MDKLMEKDNATPQDIMGYCTDVCSKYKSNPHYEDIVSASVLKCLEVMRDYDPEQYEGNWKAYLYYPIINTSHSYSISNSSPCTLPKGGGTSRAVKGLKDGVSNGDMSKLQMTLSSSGKMVKDDMIVCQDHSEKYIVGDIYDKTFELAKNNLTPSEYSVFRMLYGKETQMSQVEVSRKLKCTKANVSNLNRSALGKLKHLITM